MQTCLFVAIICANVWFSLEQFTGDTCTLQNKLSGRCIRLSECDSAIENIAKSIPPQICDFSDKEPLVCCKVFENIVTRPEYRDGRISRKKCQTYHTVDDSIVFPEFGVRHNAEISETPHPPLQVNSEEKSLAKQIPQMIKGKYGGLSPFVVGGVKSTAKEFPHMAALGFGDQNDIKWYCGGSLISEEYVVTAAHCLLSKSLGEVKWVRLGDLNLHSTTDDALPQDFFIIKRIPHPDFNPPLQYNDIALVQLDQKAQINDYVKPICLYTNKDLPDIRPIATGWGDTQFGGEQSDVLMKVTLNYFNNERCKKAYSENQRRLTRGIVDDTQICAGGINEKKDTCQGDSGGPLQFFYDGIPHLVGVTSFGRACGVANSPGVYTRVSYFVPWIESVVWQN